MIPITSRLRLATLLGASLVVTACSGVKTPSGGGGGGGGTTPHSISGTVFGLAGTGLVLQNNGGDSLNVTADGTYIFPTKVTGAYAVT